jgi:spermidine synthase
MGLNRLSRPQSLFGATVLAVGLSGMVAQIVLLRELLVTFLGNEISVGIILGNWLLLEASGSYLGKGIEKSRDRIAVFVLVTLVFSLTLPLSLYLSRSIKPILGVSRGEGLGAAHMLFASLLILMPAAVSHGALFTMGAKIYAGLYSANRAKQGIPRSGKAQPGVAPAAGVVYCIEVAGTALGGILFTYVLLPFFHSFHIVSAVMLANLLLCLLLLLLRARILKPMTRLPTVLTAAALAAATCMAAYAAVSEPAEYLQNRSIRRQWGDLGVVFYKNSPYGNVAVTVREKQYDFYSDGVPIITLPHPDIAAAEDFVHFPFLYHPSPRRVLLISGGAGGVLAEMCKHDLERIDYVELDPLLFQALDRFASPEAQREWHNPRVGIRLADGRRFLAGTRERYDIILIGLSDPRDLQINRFFSREFFDLSATRLSPGGILFLTLPGSLTYLNAEMQALNACVLQTLREVFLYVTVIPGEENLYLASQSTDFSALGAEGLKVRLHERGVSTRLFNPPYIDYRLRPDRSRWLAEILDSVQAGANRDFRPIGVFYSLGLWNAQFAPYGQRVFRFLGRLTLAPVAAFCILLTALLLVLDRVVRGSLSRTAIPFAVATTGFCGMLFDLMVVFSFQVLYGYVYHRIGLIITAFMAGTGCGGLLATRTLAKRGGRLHTLLVLEAGLVAVCLLLLVLFQLLLPRWSRSGGSESWYGEVPFFAAALICGALIGGEFPVAVSLAFRTGKDFSRSVGITNAADLFGGWGAGIFGGVVLLPVLGLPQTCLILALLKLCSLALLTLSRRGIEELREA